MGSIQKRRAGGKAPVAVRIGGGIAYRGGTIINGDVRTGLSSAIESRRIVLGLAIALGSGIGSWVQRHAWRIRDIGVDGHIQHRSGGAFAGAIAQRRAVGMHTGSQAGQVKCY